MQERLQDKINFDFLSGMELYRRPCSETEKKLKKLAFGKTLQLLASRPSGYHKNLFLLTWKTHF